MIHSFMKIEGKFLLFSGNSKRGQVIQKLMGHGDGRMTQRYAPPARDNLKRAIASILGQSGEWLVPSVGRCLDIDKGKIIVL